MSVSLIIFRQCETDKITGSSGILSEAYSELYQISQMKSFVKIVNGF